MKISISAAKQVGKKLLKYVIDTTSDIAFVTTSSNDLYAAEISALCLDNNIVCYRDLDLNSQEFVDLLLKHNIDFHFMLWFPTILQKKTIQAVKKGFINLHPSLLPYNRGMHPWYWSIVNNTPAGVTIHFIDEKIDNGPILAQEIIAIQQTDTGETLYAKLCEAIIALFTQSFKSIMNESYSIINVDHKGTFHLAKEIENHSKIELDKMYKAETLINILRARSFENGDNAYFYKNDKKYSIKLCIDES